MRRQREEAGRRQPEKRTGTMQFEEIRRRLLSLLENRDELSDQDANSGLLRPVLRSKTAAMRS